MNEGWAIFKCNVCGATCAVNQHGRLDPRRCRVMVRQESGCPVRYWCMCHPAAEFVKVPAMNKLVEMECVGCKDKVTMHPYGSLTVRTLQLTVARAEDVDGNITGRLRFWHDCCGGANEYLPVGKAEDLTIRDCKIVNRNS